jgi:hypothetical protein
MPPPFKNVFDLVQGRSHWSWLYSALSTIRDLFTIAQFGRITRPHQAFPFTTWQRVRWEESLLIACAPFFFR